MSELSLAAAFVVGLLGSVHCIGMCGGIAGMLGSASSMGGAPAAPRRWLNLLGYNLGRIVSYGVAGLVAGFAGNRAFDLFPMERVAELGLMLSGGFMILMGLYLAEWWRGLDILERAGSVLWRRLQPLSTRLLPVRSAWQSVPLGLVWGWLPCGLVYATLVWALFTADPVRSMALMIAFGLGTLPMLLAIGGAAGAIAAARSRPLVRRTAGVIIIVFGVLTFLGLVHPIHPVDHPVGLVCDI